MESPQAQAQREFFASLDPETPVQSNIEKLKSLRIETKEHQTSDVRTLCVRSKKELAREIVRLQGLLLQAQRMNNNLINGILEKLDSE